RFGESVTAGEQKVMDFVSTLAKARRKHPALRYGARRALLVERDRYAFLKHYFGDAEVIAWNRSSTAEEMNLKVAPEIEDGTELIDILDNSHRSVRVENGAIKFTLEPMRSSMFVVR
ncbi:TPA: hypothetical protein DEF17_08590, partial [bacterium]|nr:hypothetical protein [bacterium]